jgi:uncharacterized membrane protein YkoI
MLRRVLPALSLATVLGLTGPAGLGVDSAVAASCYSQAQVRQAVQAGQVIQLSSVLNQIRAAVPGQIVSQPMLCDMGGRMVYLVDVLSGGAVTHVQIDAQTGSINY